MGYLVSIQSSRTARRMLNTFRRLATQAMSSSIPSPSCMPGAVLLTRGPACSVWAASLRWPPDCGYLCVDAITFGACLVVPMAKHGRVRARCAAPSCRGMTYGLKDYLMDFHATRLLANCISASGALLGAWLGVRSCAPLVAWCRKRLRAPVSQCPKIAA